MPFPFFGANYATKIFGFMYPESCVMLSAFNFMACPVIFAWTGEAQPLLYVP
jgi:hypothetical protein